MNSVHLHLLCDIVCASMVLWWFHLNVSTSNQCCLYPHQQNRLAYIESSEHEKQTNKQIRIKIDEA